MSAASSRTETTSKGIKYVLKIESLTSAVNWRVSSPMWSVP